MTGYARDALPLLAGWLGATVVFHGRFVPTWLVGVTAGVLLRAAILGHWYAKELTFLLVALIFIGVFAFGGAVRARPNRGLKPASGGGR